MPERDSLALLLFPDRALSPRGSLTTSQHLLSHQFTSTSFTVTAHALLQG